MLSVLLAEEHKAEHWEEQVDHMVTFLAHLPGGNCSWICFTLEVISSSVKPMSVAVNMEFVEVSELIHWMVLQIVGFDLVVFCGFRLVHVSGGVAATG